MTCRLALPHGKYLVFTFNGADNQTCAMLLSPLYSLTQPSRTLDMLLRLHRLPFPFDHSDTSLHHHSPPSRLRSPIIPECCISLCPPSSLMSSRVHLTIPQPTLRHHYPSSKHRSHNVPECLIPLCPPSPLIPFHVHAQDLETTSLQRSPPTSSSCRYVAPYVPSSLSESYPMSPQYCLNRIFRHHLVLVIAFGCSIVSSICPYTIFVSCIFSLYHSSFTKDFLSRLLCLQARLSPQDRLYLKPLTARLPLSL